MPTLQVDGIIEQLAARVRHKLHNDCNAHNTACKAGVVGCHYLSVQLLRITPHGKHTHVHPDGSL
jgi:hypothetical protein